MKDQDELITAQGIEVDFCQQSISPLPDVVQIPPVSSWSQEIVPGQGNHEFIIRRRGTKEEVERIRGAHTYLQIPNRDDLLDIIFTHSSPLNYEATGVAGIAFNHIIIQESAWREISKNGLKNLRDLIGIEVSRMIGLVY